MEFEEIVKRLEWLDTQQRQARETLARLDERLTSFETTVNAVSKQIKAVEKQLTDIGPAAKRLEQFETLLSKQRTDIIKLIETNEKARLQGERETAKQMQAEFADVNKSVAQLKATGIAQEFKKLFKERANEMERISNNINDFKTSIEETVHSNENMQHSLKAMDETRKNDLKRIADIQGDITALRKYLDENKEKSAINADGIRNMENRFAELLASEAERRQAQTTFLEQQSLAQIERDRAWKDWKEKYEVFLKEAGDLDSQVQTLDETMRGAKKAQEAYLELNTKLERRIAEVTEMQRLAEDRLRQEWIGFKTDDQKRWTGYTLSSEESFRDIRKGVQKIEETTTTLGDVAQVLKDQMHQTTDTTEQQLQELMNVVHEWMTSYQRIMGHGKKPKKK
jgi:chromosome segregation ATPase